MAGGAAGEPSAKRTKVDEEEDPLVQRREELLGFPNARAEGRRLVREAEEEAERLIREAKAEGKRMVREAKERAAIIESDSRALSEARRNTRSITQELRSVCADLEAENEQHLSRLHPDLWQKIINENLHQNDLIAFALTCRFFREKQKDLGKKMKTDLNCDNLLDLRKSGMVPSRTLGWFWWVCDTFELLPGFKWGSKRVEGAVYEGDLVNYAAFQGSVEILRWLMEEKGCEPNGGTGWLAAMGGSVEILEYLKGEEYEFREDACRGAARGGHLKALKYLRGLDPPCPWDMLTCSSAAWGGNLDVLKWLRSQDPPCPWDEETCAGAARRGHLEVLKWARDQDPPCPWDASACSAAALGGHLDVVKFLRQDPPCPWNGRTCSSAAKGGRLEILVWLRNHGCPWSAKDCALKAEKAGHDHVVRWIKCNAM